MAFIKFSKGFSYSFNGLRQSDVLRLAWGQVNLELRHAWVKDTQSKNRRPISLPLNDVALAILKRQVGKHPERVFTYRGNGGAVCPSGAGELGGRGFAVGRRARPGPTPILNRKRTRPRKRKPSGPCCVYWWPGAESNCRHTDFQSVALPTELPSRNGCGL